ncbi:MAG: endonuclease/exonuclease/phosphatase family protein [Cyclobacteriaceae bacterium]
MGTTVRSPAHRRLPSLQYLPLHPKPPVPGETSDSRQRDAEILIIGNRISKSANPVLVAGDFNDVAWSHTTLLFQKVSGLLDPRTGRGFYNTFHADYFPFRWPLDHVFLSAHFKLLEMKRLPDIDSDHFPIYLKLSYEPSEKQEQQAPAQDEDTAEEATQTIEEGIEDASKSNRASPDEE